MVLGPENLLALPGVPSIGDVPLFLGILSHNCSNATSQDTTMHRSVGVTEGPGTRITLVSDVVKVKAKDGSGFGGM